MITRRLGASGPEVSALGLGCMGMSQGYGPTDDEASLATVHRALDLGVTFFDTSMSYGTGHNERLLGMALAGRRERAVLASKFGIVRDPERGVRLDGRPEHVRGYCEASLRRLGTDHIDLYYLHRVDPEVPVEETVGAMAELVADGTVGHLGLSETTVDQLERAVATHPIAALQSEWSLWWREPEDDVVPAAARLGVGFVPYSPLGRAFLTGTVSAEIFGHGDMRASDQRFSPDHREHNLALLDEVAHMAADYGATPGQLALAWLLAKGEHVVPIPGTKRAERVEENAAAAAVELAPSDVDRLEKLAPRSAWHGDRSSFAAHRTERGG